MHVCTHVCVFLWKDSVAEVERERYRELMDVIAWFFFDLLVLGYAEDPETGLSFRIPGGLEWAIYIEVSPNCQKSLDTYLTYDDIHPT